MSRDSDPDEAPGLSLSDDRLARSLIRLGYWDGPHTAPGWPDPRDFVDPEWDEEERDDVYFYLREGLVVEGAKDFSAVA